MRMRKKEMAIDTKSSINEKPAIELRNVPLVRILRGTP
jgi:hypothetical protein